MDTDIQYPPNLHLNIPGDGIVFEVFNGLMKREDHAEAIKIPLAIIPGGSGN